MSVSGSVSAEAVSQYLQGQRLITAEQAATAEEYSRNNGECFTHALVSSGQIDGDFLAATLSRCNGNQALDVDGLRVLPYVLQLVPLKLAAELRILPLHRQNDILFTAVPAQWKKAGEIARIEKQTGLHVETIPVSHVDVTGIVYKCHQLLKMRSMRERRIGQALVERGYITGDQLQTALQLHRQRGVRLGRALTELGYIAQQGFLEVLADRLGIPLWESDDVVDKLQPEVCRMVTQSFTEHNMLLPFSKEGDTLQVATAYPVDLNTQETLKALTDSRRIQLVLVEEEGLQSVIRAVYSGGPIPAASGAGSETEETKIPALAKGDDLSLDVEVQDVKEGDEFDQDIELDPGVPRIINYMLYQAVKKGASDLHIEQYEDRADLKFRIDGQMRPMTGIPIDRENVVRIVSKLKIDAQLDIAERRKPQDGSFRKKFGEKLLVDFRLATQPTLYGENVVIRILDRTSPLPTIPQLGMPDKMRRRYMRQIQSPQGMVIFTGPTGSGKTTTLYCTLEVLRQQALKIITAEDPIEYQFDGIQQCQVNEHIGNTFGKYLRGFLRQDPDVILIGEVRDEDTAINSVRAAITGHLIFSTIHASDTIGVIRRFTDMGVDTNMLSMSMVSIVYQRLVRRICVNCKEPFTGDKEEIEDLQLENVLEGVQLFHGAGCDQCDNSGYRGRIAVYEMWEPGEEERDLVARNVDERELRAGAIRNGLEPLVVDAVAKVKSGMTTLDELQEVIPYNQIIRASEFVKK